MNQNYAVIGCIPQFCMDLREFTEKIKITINTKGYDMELGSKNLSVAIGFIGKTTNALSLKCMMEFDDIVNKKKNPSHKSLLKIPWFKLRIIKHHFM